MSRKIKRHIVRETAGVAAPPLGGSGPIMIQLEESGILIWEKYRHDRHRVTYEDLLKFAQDVNFFRPQRRSLRPYRARKHVTHA